MGDLFPKAPGHTRPWGTRGFGLTFSFPRVCVPSHHMASGARALPLPTEAALEARGFGSGAWV